MAPNRQMNLIERNLLSKARGGDIRAFHDLFIPLQPRLRSYLFRLMGDRHEMEDIAQDTFVEAFEAVSSFRGKSGLKTWIFSIATHLALRRLQRKKRWAPDTQLRTRNFAHEHEEAMGSLDRAHQLSPFGAFEIREHIDYCFTCMAKTLPIDQQVALILKDVYDFTVEEIAKIINVTAGKVKHLLHDSRRTMVEVFDHQCALVNKEGVCYQCSGLNKRFNPRQNTQEALMKIRMVREAGEKTNVELYKLRAELVRGIDPLDTAGADLHEAFLKIASGVNEDPAH